MLGMRWVDQCRSTLDKPCIHAKMHQITCIYIEDSSSETLASIDAVFGALSAPQKAGRGSMQKLYAEV